MVICKYFQNGNCRFGSKCMNEHFDVKAVIKSEVEAALKGSQWPLSCFGPFKEKPCIPNFIEDQSFEEIRYMCYEARKQNCFPAFHQQFTQQVIDAQNKMKALLTLNREVIDVISSIHNSTNPPKTWSQGGNPFSLGGNSNANQGTTNSLFGSSNATQSNPFSSVGGSIFGGSTPSNSGSIFGGQSVNSAGQNGIIGQSAFGSAGFTNSQGSVFGQQSNSFGQIRSNQFQQQQQGSIFGGGSQPQQTSFGSMSTPTATSNFGALSQTNAFGQPQQQAISGGNLFGRQNQTSGFGGFGQPQIQQQQSALAPTPAFGVQQPATQTGLFGQNQSQSNQSIFASAQPQQNIFNQVKPQPSQQQIAFGSQLLNSTFAPTQEQQQQSGVFTEQTVFGNVSQPQPEQQFTQPQFDQVQQQNAFQQQQVSTFTGSNQQSASAPSINIPISENLYSKLEALTSEEIESFKAESFQIGKIPTKPPPRELVVFRMVKSDTVK